MILKSNTFVVNVFKSDTPKKETYTALWAAIIRQMFSSEKAK